MRYHGSNDEVALFGVNYAVPFAHEYRAFHKLGYDYKEQIDKDVYHMTRMGVDALRMHIWDTEISDSLGNMLDNQHLDLLDYLIAKLKERNIQVILTPITFYNNAYPDGATPTPGFANYISKGDAPKKREYWPVIKRYLKQFINHTNPYTGTTYKNESDIIALEIVNEPAHDDPDSTQAFINTMADHLRSEGWSKPIFYNIAQNPRVAQSVMRSDVDGLSFQWYPAGLVGGEEIHTNYLPYVDRYPIPFKNEPAFKNKAQMVYEFSPADFPGSYAYAVMARSFRQAGFQFATQFAYDAMALADINTAYRTHFLNLAYTPSKAIGFKIASAVFHQWPRSGDIKSYPADTTFGHFVVSDAHNLAVMNADTAFFYTNSTDIPPANSGALKHVAGVGSSQIVKYKGTGAYFLDKLKDGVWRLEVMPDAVHFRDPFAVTAFDKKLVQINWREYAMAINLPDLGQGFRVQGLNEGNTGDSLTNNGTIKITPGAYLLVKSEGTSSTWTADTKVSRIKLGEFAAPKPSDNQIHVRHDPVKTVRAGQAVNIQATIAGLEPSDKVQLVVQSGWRPMRIEMKENQPYHYQAEIPAKNVNPGLLTYWIVVEHDGKPLAFPGAHQGFPGAWDFYYKEQWTLSVIKEDDPFEIFSAKENWGDIDYAFSFWNSRNRTKLIPSSAGEMAVQVTAGEPTGSNTALGWGCYVGDRWDKANPTARGYDQLGLRLRADSLKGAQIKMILADKLGQSFSTIIEATNDYKDRHIPLRAFKADSMLLLPRPFPVFLPLWFKANTIGKLKTGNIEKVQFVLESRKGQGVPKGASFAVEKVWLEK